MSNVELTLAALTAWNVISPFPSRNASVFAVLAEEAPLMVVPLMRLTTEAAEVPVMSPLIVTLPPENCTQVSAVVPGTMGSGVVSTNSDTADVAPNRM